MPTYNLIEYSDNYSKTSWSLWQYHTDEPFTENTDIPDNLDTTSFKYKQNITNQTGNNGTKDIQTIVPLKYLSNFWGTLEMSLINCEINIL